MATAHPCVFVLWGSNFDEVTATIFVTELRQAGLRVKVIGLDGSSPAGAHGLALVPDMPLSKALPLAERATCVIIPSALSLWLRIQDDPRVETFLQRSWANQAMFVIGSEGGTCADHHIVPSGQSHALLPPDAAVIEYPDCESLPRFARSLADSLSIR